VTRLRDQSIALRHRLAGVRFFRLWGPEHRRHWRYQDFRVWHSADITSCQLQTCWTLRSRNLTGWASP